MQKNVKLLNLSQKLLLSILSFSIPILMLLDFTISGINYNINFARLEIFGSRLLKPLSFFTKVHHGVANISKVSAELTKIIEQVQALSPNVEGVNTAMQNQSESVQTIHDSIVELSQGMQRIKNSLQQTYIAIEGLNEMTNSLREQVSRFQVNA